MNARWRWLARLTIACLVLATSVIVGRSPGRLAAAIESSRSRQVSGSAARTTRSAPATASASEVAARSMIPSARATAGPRPVGLQATTESKAAADRLLRMARAMEPPIRPRPTIARRNDRVGLVDPAGTAADRRRGPSGFPAPGGVLAAGCDPTLAGARRSGLVRGVHPTGDQAPLAVAPILVQVRPAARTAALFGEERLERRRGVDLPPAGAAGESGHTRIVPRLAGQGADSVPAVNGRSRSGR